MTSLSQKHLTLSKTPLFAGLEPVEIDAMAQRAVEKRYAAGEVLAREGEPCSGLFVLGQGSVKIYKTSSLGREVMLAVEAAPSSVAEVPLFDGGPYPATVSALDDVVAYLIGTQDFRWVCRNNPEVPLKVLATMGRRLRTLVAVVESVTFGSVRQRLARLLLDFAEQEGRDSFLLPITHQELALRLGTVREVVSRNLSRFQAEGLLRIQRREISVVDRDGLLREAETEL
jgi:CRP/FNR family transcriptional regulator